MPESNPAPSSPPTLALGQFGQSPWTRAARRFVALRTAVAASLFLLALLLAVFSSPVWWPHHPETLTQAQWASPSLTHWLGTDANGRDLLARICAGARISLWVGLAGAVVSLVIGVVWGAVAGYVGGRLDGVLMRTVDILYSLPSVIFIIVLLTTLQAPARAILARLGSGQDADHAPLLLLILGLGAISWLTMARIVRTQVMSLRQRPFVEASIALGAGHARLLFRHILPNTTGVILTYLTLTLPTVVLAESFLSYLGLGVQPPQASLGTLIAEGAAQINPIRTYGWLLAGPAGMLVGLLLALGFLGDGIRDALDPRS
ncbi:MAG: ABC transporter permease [Verrucomicrobiae bacterium]|nr:ABC transporter permease [Verrucomicrobiae bacterium]